MRKLGQLLLANGVINQSQLDEGLQSQVAFGARLGTNLVELDYLNLDQLAEYLAKQQRVPVTPPEWLENIATPALHSLPLDLVKRFRALPLKLEDGLIHVAMLDPRAPHHIADIALTTSRRVHPYVLPELRLYYWLERHYSLRRGPRYMFAQAETLPDLVPRVVTGTPSVVAATRELTDEATFESIYAGSFGATPPLAMANSPAPVVPLSAPLVLEPTIEVAPVTRASALIQLERELKAAADRDEIIAKGCELALTYVRCVAVFVVHRGEVQAARIAGEVKGHVPIERIGLPMSVECIVTRTAAKGEAFRGNVPQNDIDEKILRALGRRMTKEAVVLPVKIRGRVVNVLYFDNGGDELPDCAYAAIASIAETMSASYERLILERKRGELSDSL